LLKSEELLAEVGTEIDMTDHETLTKISRILSQCKGTVWTVGNGGSASTMSHMTADLRTLGINSNCLTDNMSQLTAKVNDFGWEDVYTHIIENLFNQDDILVIASVNGSAGRSPAGTSWSSNLFRLAENFLTRSSNVIGLIGNNGGQLKNLCSLSLCGQSKNPYIIEGVHSVWAHIIVACVKRMSGEYDE